MKTAYRYLVMCVGLAACLQLLVCSGSNIASGGTTTETTNGITASVTLPQGQPAVGAQVQIRPIDYLSGSGSASPATIAQTQTNSSGSLYLAGIKRGLYRITIITADTLLGTLFDSVRIDADPGLLDTTVALGSKTLGKMGSIHGIVPDVDNSPLTLQLFGTDRLVHTYGGMPFTLGKLPAGTYQLRAATLDRNLTIERRGLLVVEDSTTHISLFDAGDPLRFAGNIDYTIDMSARGAAIAGDLTFFPLPVRLDGSSPHAARLFQSAASPSQLRFVDRNGTSLPFSVEKWDSPAQSALFWLEVPLILGAKDNNGLTLLYGAPDSALRPEALFPPGKGYSAIWHMNRSTGDTLSDATGQHPAVVRGSGATFMPDAVLNGGVSISGLTGWIDAGEQVNLFNDNMAVTLSAWVRVEQMPFSIFTAATDSLITAVSLSITTQGHIRACAAIGTDAYQSVESQAAISPSQWYHIAAVISIAGDSVLLYLNGERLPAVGTVAFTSDRFTENDCRWVVLGSDRQGPAGVGRGALDEVHIFRDAREADWVRACYLSQRSGQTMVREMGTH